MNLRYSVPIFFFLFFCSIQNNYSQDFITKWTFFYPRTQISFSALTTDTVQYTWKASPSGKSGSGHFSMTSPGQITLDGLDIEAGDTLVLTMAPENLSRFYFITSINKENIIDVVQWGAVSWTSMKNTFYECLRLNISASDKPDFTNVKDMSGMFLGASSFNQDINDWDVSNVTNMSSMFSSARAFNGNISSWDVSHVGNMEGMFYDAHSFNQDIGSWNVSSVKNMAWMFSKAFSFNQYIGDWKVSMVEDMWSMFYEADSFNKDIGDWDVSSVSRMRDMFLRANSFNQDIGNWDVSNVTVMKRMFSEAESFNQNINNWDVSNVVYMDYMFEGAIAFNQPLNNWNVSNVKDMKGMFDQAESFNQYIGDWDVSNVTLMNFMFYEASSFNQDIGSWDVSNVREMAYMFNDSPFNHPIDKWDVSSVINMIGMFTYSDFNQNIGSWKLNANVKMDKMLTAFGMDCDHYSATLVGWQVNNPSVTDVTLGAAGLRYGTSAVEARDSLIYSQSWTIHGDEAVNAACDALVSADFIPVNKRNALTIYPNPASGQINIKGDQIELEDIRVLNSIGQDVTAQLVIQERSFNSTTIDLSNLMSGVYYMYTSNGSGTVYKL